MAKVQKMGLNESTRLDGESYSSRVGLCAMRRAMPQAQKCPEAFITTQECFRCQSCVRRMGVGHRVAPRSAEG